MSLDDTRGLINMHTKSSPLLEEAHLFLNDSEAARLFNIGKTTFRKLVRLGQFPPPIKLGNCSRWERSALLTAAASLRRRELVAGAQETSDE